MLRTFYYLIFYYLSKLINNIPSELSIILIIIVPILISVAFFTLIERKVLGTIQRRKGPNVIGTYGLLQPLADGFKLFVKEPILPTTSDALIFFISPLISFITSLMGWVVVPYGKYSTFSEINLSLLYLFAVSSLGVYGIIMSGWSSNSKYAFLGSLRSTAQMISYEVSIGFILVTIAGCAGSFDLNLIIESQKNVWFIVTFLPLLFLFFISSLAETNRHPFDLPEAEAELVSGYNVEYSAMSFALFSLSEYSNMLLISSLNVILFMGGWSAPIKILNCVMVDIWFGLKILIFVILFIWARAALPRYRYDQLMELGWKVFLPFSLTYLMLIISFIFVFNMLPY